MCGIAGIYSHSGSHGIDLTDLSAMRKALLSRGPDGQGQWLADNRSVGFAHCRLAIIDLSDEAGQPMVSACGRYSLVYNGEIYNYQLLRQKLVEQGYPLKTESDSEVIIALYDLYGADMIHRLRGMFAFAIWDNKKQMLFLARDPYGIKPLYYTELNGSFHFASQVKSLLQVKGISKAVDPAGEAGFYVFGFVPEPYTWYQDIKPLPAGTWMSVGKGGEIDRKKYFSVADIWEKAAETADGQTHDLSAALLDSVKHHLVSDVPVGLFLSSGVDSAAIAALARDAGLSDLRTMTLGFEEFSGSEQNEVPLAKQVADKYGYTHSTRWVTQEEFKADLPAIFKAMDQPSIDGINTWFASKAAKEAGIKVSLSGLGGDELFAGYPSFSSVPRWHKRIKVLGRFPGALWLMSKAGGLAANLFKLSPKIKGLKHGRSLQGAWLLKRAIYLPEELSGLMDRERAQHGLEQLWHGLEWNRDVPADSHELPAIASWETEIYMRNQLLRDADWAGMAHGIEIRVPFVDPVLLKAVSPQIGQSYVQGQGKRILAAAPHHPLPDSVLNRKKTGFETPLKHWQENVASGVNGQWARDWARIVVKESVQ